MVKSTIKSDFRLSNLVKILSESPSIPAARPYMKRNIEAESYNDYHHQYYHLLNPPKLEQTPEPKPTVETKLNSVPSIPRPEEPKATSSFKPAEAEVKENLSPSIPMQRLCPDCGEPLEPVNNGCGGWTCNNDRCLVTKVVFNHRHNGSSRCISWVIRATIL